MLVQPAFCLWLARFRGASRIVALHFRICSLAFEFEHYRFDKSSFVDKYWKTCGVGRSSAYNRSLKQEAVNIAGKIRWFVQESGEDHAGAIHPRARSRHDKFTRHAVRPPGERGVDGAEGIRANLPAAGLGRA